MTDRTCIVLSNVNQIDSASAASSAACTYADHYLVNFRAKLLTTEMQDVLLAGADSLFSAFHLLARTLFADIHQELLALGDVQQIQIGVGRIDRYRLAITEVVEGLDESSAALAGAHPCIAGRAFDLVLNADLFDNIRLILL